MNRKKTITSILFIFLILSLVGCNKEKANITKNETKPTETLNEQSKTEEGKKQEDQVETNVEKTGTTERTQTQGISVIYPSNWDKKNIKGHDIFFLEDKITNVNLVVDNMRGLSEENYKKAAKQELKTKFGVDNIEEKEYKFNNKNATIIRYFKKYEGTDMPTYQVVFFNNTMSYTFTICGPKEISNKSMESFDSMLKTVEFVS